MPDPGSNHWRYWTEARCQHTRTCEAAAASADSDAGDSAIVQVPMPPVSSAETAIAHLRHGPDLYRSCGYCGRPIPVARFRVVREGEVAGVWRRERAGIPLAGDGAIALWRSDMIYMSMQAPEPADTSPLQWELVGEWPI